MWLRACLIGAVLACAALAGDAVAATAAAKGATAPGAVLSDSAPPLPIGAFYTDPAISGAQISPAGKSLAMIRHDKDAVGIEIQDLATGEAKVIFGTGAKDTYLTWLRWKGENRLLVGATYIRIDRAGGRPDGAILRMAYAQYVLAMDADGKNTAALLRSNHGVAWRFGTTVQLLDSLRGDPDHVLITAPREDGTAAVWRTDVKTGAAQMIEAGDDDTLQWDTDRNGAVVARYEQRGRDVLIQGRAPGEKGWTDITRVRQKDIKALSDFDFLGPAQSPATLYVAVKPQTPDQGAARAVRVYDFRTHTLGPQLWAPLDYDVSDIVTDPDTNALQAVCYWVDVYRCDYKSPEMQANFRGLDRFFHGERSLVPISHSDDARWWLFEVSGPTEPGSYYLYDWKNKTAENLGSLYQGLPAEKLGTMQRFTYAASDGVKIPAYLTRPPGAPSGPLPLVVIPHGGPEARDDYDYDPWSQIIATRGYLVLRPNYRGSGGYGVAFAESGYRKWGARMEDDITDGIKALVDSGQADPKRICIFGASYGGYAALIGGAQRPDLYKCVVSWAGISDLGAFMRFKRGGLFVGERSPAYDYWVKAIGDPDADKARLDQASAVTYAATYGPPVLLIHGDSDTNVPPDQSREMERALKAAHRDVKLTLIKGEDHTDWDSDHEQAAITEVADFITAHIAPAKLAPVKPAAADTAPPAAASTPAAPTRSPSAAAPSGPAAAGSGAGAKP